MMELWAFLWIGGEGEATAWKEGVAAMERSRACRCVQRGAVAAERWGEAAPTGPTGRE